MDKYQHKNIEKKWQNTWAEQALYKTPDTAEGTENFYMLVEFPYPSGNLHVGHWYAFSMPDILARAKRMQGQNVLFPIGFDAFGLPAENAAIKHGLNPRDWTEQNIAHMTGQLESMGASFDWTRQVITCRPDYYRWTQWLFIQLFNKGLVQQQETDVNWCLLCKTVLANEQVVNGYCERCDSEVQKKQMQQWNVKITDYADRLVDDLDDLDWPEEIKHAQKNWIGRSEGAVIKFPITNYQFPMSQNNVEELGAEGATEILLATNNAAKVARVKQLLAAAGMNVVVHTPQELGIVVDDVEENGTLEENAIAKARAYAGTTELPILANDTSLIIDGEELDPVKVKRNALDGEDEKNFSQEEIAEKCLAFYKNIARAHGGEVSGRFYEKWALVSPGGSIDVTDATRELTLTDEVKGAVDPYFPIRSLYRVNDTGKYVCDQTPEEELIELGPVMEALKKILTPHSSQSTISVFTTRPDTLFGATYMVLAPEHALVQTLMPQVENGEDVQAYVQQAQKKSEIERTNETKEKTGVQLEGVMAVNPANGEEIPIYIADYVLAHYGTGAIMAVPAHDERDYAFAKKYGIAIREVVNNAQSLTSEQKMMLSEYDSEKSKGYLERTVETIPDDYTYFLNEFIHTYQEQQYGQDSILELGSGSGVAADYIEGKGLSICRSDAVEYFVDFQKQQERNSVKKINIVTNSLGIEQYTAVLAVSVLHHLIEEQLTPALEKINRSLQEGGLLVFRNKLAQHTTTAEGITAVYTNFTTEQLTKKLTDAGFKIIKMEERDSGKYQHVYIFAKKVREVDVFAGAGTLMNSGKFDGMNSEDAKAAITEKVGGAMTKTYKLRDWTVSRQRYWGVPIPLVYCAKCAEDSTTAANAGEQANPGWFAVPDAQLPLELPEVDDYLPRDDGQSPLAKADDFVKTTCPRCGGEARRETDTLDTFVCSSWYFLRYTDAQNEVAFADAARLADWMPVDFYSGGAEHTTMHLLYSRFFHKALFDCGLVEQTEPYTRRLNRGLIMGPDGNKMSKSKGNVIDPDDIVAQLGADTMRLYLAFIGPYNEVGSYPWSPEGIIGMRRFLEKVWRLQEKSLVDDAAPSKELEAVVHRTIKKVTEDIAALKFNTAVAQLMTLVKTLERQETLQTKHYHCFLMLLSPFAPHLAEELWERAGQTESIFMQSWPSYDATKVVAEEIQLIIQVNGKVRDKLMVPAEIDEETAKDAALTSEKVQKFIDGKEVRKVIFVKGKLVSIVV